MRVQAAVYLPFLDKPDNPSHSLALQRKRVRALCEAHSIEVIEQFEEAMDLSRGTEIASREIGAQFLRLLGYRFETHSDCGHTRVVKARKPQRISRVVLSNWDLAFSDFMDELLWFNEWGKKSYVLHVPDGQCYELATPEGMLSVELQAIQREYERRKQLEENRDLLSEQQ